MSVKNSSDAIGYQICDLLAYSTVPQPTVLLHAWGLCITGLNMNSTDTTATQMTVSDGSSWLPTEGLKFIKWFMFYQMKKRRLQLWDNIELAQQINGAKKPVLRVSLAVWYFPKHCFSKYYMKKLTKQVHKTLKSFQMFWHVL